MWKFEGECISGCGYLSSPAAKAAPPPKGDKHVILNCKLKILNGGVEREEVFPVMDTGFRRYDKERRMQIEWIIDLPGQALTIKIKIINYPVLLFYNQHFPCFSKAVRKEFIEIHAGC